MGLTNYSGAFRNCATCVHWAGPRKADTAAGSVQVNGAAVGVCNGFWKGSRKYPNDKCSEWSKWPELGETKARQVYP